MADEKQLLPEETESEQSFADPDLGDNELDIDANAEIQSDIASIQDVIREAEKRLADMQARFAAMEKETNELSKKLENFDFGDMDELTMDLSKQMDELDPDGEFPDDLSEEKLAKLMQEAKKTLGMISDDDEKAPEAGGGDQLAEVNPAGEDE